jgi:hypothetical protein
MDSTMFDKKLSQLPPSAAGDLAVKLLQTHNLPADQSMGGMPDILVGMHTLPVSPTQMSVVKMLIESRHGTVPEFYTSQTQDYWDQKKEYINSLMETAPSHYQYLKENIYKGKE